jgi:hypothetical protein
VWEEQPRKAVEAKVERSEKDSHVRDSFRRKLSEA